MWAIGFGILGFYAQKAEAFETARLQNERDRLVKRRMERMVAEE